MPEESTSSVEVFQTALAAGEPVKALMDLAARFLADGDMASMRDVDVMLDDRLIHYVRNDATEELHSFVYALLAFIDTRMGDRLRSLPEGERLVHRWEHLVDLCRLAIDNYDSRRAIRLLASRKHGEQLMRILERQGSIRFKDLALELGVKQPYLARFLKELEKEDLVVREHGKNLSMVRLGFMGRVVLKEMEEEDDDPYGEGDPGDEIGRRIGGMAGQGSPRGLLIPFNRSDAGESPDAPRENERPKKRERAA